MSSRLVIVFLGLLLAAGAGSAAAQRFDSLPPAVAAAFHQAYPDAKILHVSRELQEGKVVYEIESQDGSTRRDLLYDPEGTVIEIEEMIPADSVPAPVRAAVERDMTGATIMGAERVTRGTVVLYEVDVRKGGKSEHVTYDPDGVRKE